MGKKIIVGGVVVAVLLGVGIAVWPYLMRGNTMRSKIYRPLHQEISAVEEVVKASDITRAVPSTTYISLKKDPLWEQVPLQLRKEIQDTYDKVWDCQSEMVVARSHAAGMASLSARFIRKETDDQAWVKTVTQAGPAPGRKGQRLRREPEIDRSDPAHPRVTMPGGLIWKLTDWLDYPDNIADLDREWGEDEFLFVTDVAPKRWDTRITRDDLRRVKMTLEQFMANLNRGIENHGRIQAYREHCRVAMPMVAALKKQLEEKAR